MKPDDPDTTENCPECGAKAEGGYGFGDARCTRCDWWGVVHPGPSHLRRAIQGLEQRADDGAQGADMQATGAQDAAEEIAEKILRATWGQSPYQTDVGRAIAKRNIVEILLDPKNATPLLAIRD